LAAEAAGARASGTASTSPLMRGARGPLGAAGGARGPLGAVDSRGAAVVAIDSLRDDSCRDAVRL
jgi:hypothetical protein